MAILKGRIIYYGGIPGYLSHQQRGRLILTKEALLFSARGCPGDRSGYYRIPLAKIIRVETVKEYLQAWIRVYLVIEYLDKEDLPHHLQVRIREIGWPRVLKKSRVWTDRINNLIQKRNKS